VGIFLVFEKLAGGEGGGPQNAQKCSKEITKNNPTKMHCVTREEKNGSHAHPAWTRRGNIKR